MSDQLPTLDELNSTLPTLDELNGAEKKNGVTQPSQTTTTSSVAPVSQPIQHSEQSGTNYEWSQGIKTPLATGTEGTPLSADVFRTETTKKLKNNAVKKQEEVSKNYSELKAHEKVINYAVEYPEIKELQNIDAAIAAKGTPTKPDEITAYNKLIEQRNALLEKDVTPKNEQDYAPKMEAKQSTDFDTPSEYFDYLRQVQNQFGEFERKKKEIVELSGKFPSVKLKDVVGVVQGAATKQQELLTKIKEDQTVADANIKEAQALNRDKLTPLGFFDGFGEGMEQTTLSNTIADLYIGGKDEQLQTALENIYTDEVVFPKDKTTAGEAGELLGGQVKPLAVGVGGALVSESLTGNPLLGIGAGAAYYGRMGIGSGLMDAYSAARSQGKTQTEAYEIAQQQAKVAGAAGAVEGAVAAIPFLGKPVSKIATATFRKAVTAGLKDNAIDAVVAGTSQVIQNKNLQRLGLDVETSRGVAENMAAEFILGAGMNLAFYGGSKLKPETYNSIITGIAKLPFTEIQTRVDEAVKMGVLDEAKAQNVMQDVVKTSAALNAMPELTEKQEAAVLPKVKQIQELERKNETLAGAFKEANEARIEQLNQEIHEDLGTGLSSKEQKEYDKLIEKKEATDADGKKTPLLQSEKDKLKHYEARIERAGKNEANEVAEGLGYDNAKHLLNDLKKQGLGEFEKVQDVPKKILQKLQEAKLEPRDREFIDFQKEADRIDDVYDSDWEGLSEEQMYKHGSDRDANEAERDRLFDKYATEGQKHEAERLRKKANSKFEDLKNKVGLGKHRYDRAIAEGNYKEDVVRKYAKEASKRSQKNAETTQPTADGNPTETGNGANETAPTTEAETTAENVAEGGKEEPVLPNAEKPVQIDEVQEQLPVAEETTTINQPNTEASEEAKTNQETEVLTTSPTPEVPVEQQATTVEGEGVKKTITTTRAYEGEFREGVKKELERIGLTRDVENQQEAKGKAKEFLETVGEDAALEAVRNNDVSDAAGAYVWNELIEANNERLAIETDPAKIEELEARQAQLIDEFSRKALSGGRFASALNDIYQTSDLGYNLQKKINDFKAQNGGEIPAEVEAKFREFDRQLKEVNAKLVEAEARANEAEEKAAIQNIQEVVAREKKKAKPIVFGKKRIAKGLDDLASALGAKLSAHGEEAIKVTDALTEIGKGLIEEGIATTENVWQKVKEYVKDKFGDKVKNIDEHEEKVREAIGKANVSGKIKIPKSLIHELVKNGINNIGDLAKAVKERMKEEYPNATDREIRDAITGYGKVANLNKGEVETQVRKINRAGRIISALEDIAEKKRPLKSGAQRDKLDVEERAQLKQLREAMKDLPPDEVDIETQLKTQLDAAKQRIKNQMEDLQREIDNNELTPKDARTLKADEELTNLKDERDKLKKEHDAIFKDDAFKEARRLDLTKKANERRITELKRRLKEGDFSKNERKPLISDSELIKIKAEKLRIQEEYDKEFYKNKLQNRTPAEKAKDAVWDAWGITRVLSATGEASFVGVQGLIQTIAHPQYAVQAFKNAAKFFGSEKKTANWLSEIKAQEWYPTLKNSKLALTEPHAELTAREELFYSDWSDLVWNMIGSPIKLASKEGYEKWKAANPIKAVERGAVGYLDTMRVMRFLDGMEVLKEQGKTFENSPQDYKDVADAINTLTGRASLGKAELVAEPLSKLFFSPRNWASQFKTATPYAFYHFGKMTPTARKMAISDFSKFLGLTTGGVMLAAVGLNNDGDPETGVEFDPRSSDFMKIKLGNKRVDPWGGRIQQVVFTARLMMDMLHDVSPTTSEGGMKTGKGEIVPLGTPYKAKTKEGIAIQMAVNKLSPSSSILEKYLSSHENKEGERVDDYGKPVSVSKQLTESLRPIFVGTVADLMKDDPSALNGVLALYAFFGGGVNVYQEKDKKGSKKKP